MSEKAAIYRVKPTSEKAFQRAIQSEIRRLSHLPDDKYVAPEPGLVRSLFEFSGWTQTEGARMLKVNVATLRRWTASAEQSQSREIPYSAWMLLLLLSGHASIDNLAVRQV